MCEVYNEISFIDFIVPNSIFYDKLCMSHDKTYLFITTFIRIFIYFVIFSAINDSLKQTVFISTILIICIIMIIINVSLIPFILIKVTKY